jgi:hypothetical protein
MTVGPEGALAAAMASRRLPMPVPIVDPENWTTG